MTDVVLVCGLHVDVEGRVQLARDAAGLLPLIGPSPSLVRRELVASGDTKVRPV